MAIDPVSALSGTSASSSTTATKKKDDNSPEAIQERFMALLVAQLKNQDPLEPMDNSQVTSQMAQLNTVTGISDLNKTMDNMAATFSSTQTLQATSMLGRTVMLEGNGLTLADGNAPGAFELKATTDSVKVNVLSQGGEVLQTMDMGALKKGVHEFSWDGKTLDGKDMGPGAYKFEVVATAAGESAETVSLSQATVQGVRNTGTGALLLTSDGSEVGMSDVKQIF